MENQVKQHNKELERVENSIRRMHRIKSAERGPELLRVIEEEIEKEKDEVKNNIKYKLQELKNIKMRSEEPELVEDTTSEDFSPVATCIVVGCICFLLGALAGVTFTIQILK